MENKTKPSIWKKIKKFSAVFAVTLLSAVVLFAVGFLLYATFSPEMSVKELTSLAHAQDKTTKLYYIERTDGAETAREIEDETLFASQNREWVRYSEMPEDLINAFVAIEDHRFFDHSGVDIKRTAGAIFGYITGRSSYGGSTITQQLIKNITGEDDYSVKRKMREIIRAFKLDHKLSKEEILELYLNTIYLSEKSYGVGSAAETYFDKDVSELTLTECAALACIPQSPTKWNPKTNPENNSSRRSIVLSCMEKYGFISPAECESAQNTTLELHTESSAGAGGERIYSWYTESVINESIELLTQNNICSNPQTAKKLLYTGGLKIITAQNPLMQEKVESYFASSENFYKNGLETHPECSIVVIDPKTGGILALAGATGEKTRNRGLNYATSTLRSPGSAIKPLSVYAHALECGLISYASVFDDTPVSFLKASNGAYRPWPANYPSGYRGLTTVRDAVSRSVNTVAVKILEQLGTENAFSLLHDRMKIRSLISETTENGRVYTDIALSPMALGQLTKGVTVADITAGYTALCNGGEFHCAHTVIQILDSNGNILVDNRQDGDKIFSPQTATIMTKLLQNVTSSGTASVMDMKKITECAGKTGTTSGDKDRWYIGYTPDLLAGVWFGYPEPKALDGYPTIPSPALRTWDNIMKEINTEECLGHEVQRKFTVAEGVITATYCRDSGSLPSSACMCDLRGIRLETGYFTKETLPDSYCSRHIFVDYDIVKNAVACPSCPAENVKRVGMLGIYRALDHNIKISDAQYTYVPLSPSVPPCTNPSQPFYLGMVLKGKYAGHSGVKLPANRWCDCEDTDDEFFFDGEEEEIGGSFE